MADSSVDIVIERLHGKAVSVRSESHLNRVNRLRDERSHTTKAVDGRIAFSHVGRGSRFPGLWLFLTRLDVRHLVQLIEQLNLDELKCVVRILGLGAGLRNLRSFGGVIRVDEDRLLDAATQESHFIVHVVLPLFDLIYGCRIAYSPVSELLQHELDPLPASRMSRSSYPMGLLSYQ